jgi:hypothetical protein
MLMDRPWWDPEGDEEDDIDEDTGEWGAWGDFESYLVSMGSDASAARLRHPAGTAATDGSGTTS